MMYNNKLVCVLKVNGNVLREDKGTVSIPFGKEYTIQLKNLHNTKAVVSIEIDGDDVCDDSQYIIKPNQTVEIEGFLRGNSIANKFKFIEKTQEISNFRGDQMEDGLIKISYQFEYDWNRYSLNYWETHNGERGIVNPGTINYGSRSASSHFGGTGNPTYGSSVGSSNCGDDNTRSVNLCSTQVGATCDAQQISTSNDVYNGQESDQGITARGSESNQTFQNANVGFLDPKIHVMILQLKGIVNNGYVQTVITTRTRIQCENCGRKWKSAHKCCGNCGTSLR